MSAQNLSTEAACLYASTTSKTPSELVSHNSMKTGIEEALRRWCVPTFEIYGMGKQYVIVAQRNNVFEDSAEAQVRLAVSSEPLNMAVLSSRSFGTYAEALNCYREECRRLDGNQESKIGAAGIN